MVITAGQKDGPQPKGQGRTYQGEGPRNSAKPGAQRFAGEGAGARKMGGKTNVKGVNPLGLLLKSLFLIIM